jgi:N-acetylmuramic acid 6-phosphate etherase
MKKIFHNKLPITEQRNKNSYRLHNLSIQEILKLINKEDQKVPHAVKSVIPHLNQACQAIFLCLQSGGRVFYIGSGTSGRLGVLDASECPPTYGVLPELFQGKIAGNIKALIRSQEGVEDKIQSANDDFVYAGITKNDIVVGITASGLTPYVLAFLRFAKRVGCKTILISSNKKSKILPKIDILIAVPSGQEIVTGSTRMKAGTSQKLILNLISTTTLIRSGKVFENLMIDLRKINKKLVTRSKRNQMYLKNNKNYQQS